MSRRCWAEGVQIWVDADACPGVIKEILYRAADRLRIHVTLVANQMLRTPPSPWIHALQVPDGFDVADNEIVARVEAGDVVVTADIPLAASVLEKGGLVITPHGERYTADNIRERLSMRSFMEEMRAGGVNTGGPRPFSMADRQNFANALDRLLAQRRA